MQGKGGNGDSLIEFPNGLPPAPSRKQKEKLSEVELQAKKAEAAQRRKMQVEKALKEAEADAIRKILGLDSDKKKEEKKQKEREVKEKAAQSQISAGNIIKWVIGPTSTVVTFPDEVGLPSILNSKLPRTSSQVMWRIERGGEYMIKCPNICRVSAFWVKNKKRL